MCDNCFELSAHHESLDSSCTLTQLGLDNIRDVEPPSEMTDTSDYADDSDSNSSHGDSSSTCTNRDDGDYNTKNSGQSTEKMRYSSNNSQGRSSSVSRASGVSDHGANQVTNSKIDECMAYRNPSGRASLQSMVSDQGPPSVRASLRDSQCEDLQMPPSESHGSFSDTLTNFTSNAEKDYSSRRLENEHFSSELGSYSSFDVGGDIDYVGKDCFTMIKQIGKGNTG